MCELLPFQGMESDYQIWINVSKKISNQLQLFVTYSLLNDTLIKCIYILAGRKLISETQFIWNVSRQVYIVSGSLQYFSSTSFYESYVSKPISPRVKKSIIRSKIKNNYKEFAFIGIQKYAPSKVKLKMLSIQSKVTRHIQKHRHV